MSLLLDALKKAAQEKLDKEKRAEQPEDSGRTDYEIKTSLGETGWDTSESTEIDPASVDRTRVDSASIAADKKAPAPDQTEVDSTVLASDRTEIDAVTIAAPTTDRTEIDSTSLYDSPTPSRDDSKLNLDVESENTHIGATSIPDSDRTEYDAEVVSKLAENEAAPPESGDTEFPLNATQVEPGDTRVAGTASETTGFTGSNIADTTAGAEQELTLEPELTGLTIDVNSLRQHSATELRREISDEAERELFAFDREDTTGTQARGERTTDFDLNTTKQERENRQRTYSASLTQNLQAEQQNYVAGSAQHAAQLFAGKSRGNNTSRTRLYILSGFAAVALVLFAVIWGVAYWDQLQPDNQFRPVTGSRLNEPLSAALERNQVATQEEVDPELLIEQEDYTDLLQDTLTGYEQGTASAKPGKVDSAKSAVPVRKTVAGRSGEYSISRSKPRGEPLHNVLSRGYRAFQAGELENAEIAYRQALTRSPRNRDALLGMAAVSVAKQDNVKARDYYTRLLELDPRDDLALAGLSSLQLQPGDVAAEISRVKLLLTEKPESAQLNFTLGNLYAGERRWAEAQNAYFDAVRLDQDNPDYVFNLAVSLEHLGQSQPALQFYHRAVVLTEDRRSHFDRALALGRISTLSAK